MSPSFVLIADPPVASEDEDSLEESISYAVMDMNDLAGTPVLSASGPRAKYAVREYKGDTVLVTTNNRVLELPVNQPVAVSGLLHVVTPERPADERALDLEIEVPDKPHAGWVRADDLRWGDGIFWEPEVNGLRWIDLVVKVEPLPIKGRPTSRLQVLTAPTYFVAAEDRSGHGILVSGTLDPTPKLKNEPTPKATKGAK